MSLNENTCEMDLNQSTFLHDRSRDLSLMTINKPRGATEHDPLDDEIGQTFENRNTLM